MQAYDPVPSGSETDLGSTSDPGSTSDAGSSSDLGTSSDLGFDWEAERRWNDSPWALTALIAVAGACGAAFARVSIGGWFWLGLLGFYALCGGAGAALGMWMRRRLAARLEVPAGALPVLQRRLVKGHVPRTPRARGATEVLARKYLQNDSVMRWVSPLLIGGFLLVAVANGTDGDWSSAALWGALMCVYVASVFFRRSHRANVRSVLTAVESDESESDAVAPPG